MKMAQRVEVHRVGCAGPGDLSEVARLIESGELKPREIIAVMGKTEGNGCVNDHTRDFAATQWCHLLAPHLDCSAQQVALQVALVMSGGTEGVLSPHFTIFSRRWEEVDDSASTAKRLVLGIAHTRDFLPEELGREAQIDATAQAVRDAMADAGITRNEEVHFVQIKCPLITSARLNAALQRGAVPMTHDTYESMAYSRGASALGVAVALGECDRAAIHDNEVLHNWQLFSARASASAGIELLGNVVIVLGEAAGALSPYRIGHTVMQDAVDAASVRRLLAHQLDLDVQAAEHGPAFAASRPQTANPHPASRLVNLLAKAEASPDGHVRGQRHTMLGDSDIQATRHARAAVGGVLASIVGQTALYVSGGAEHQGPPGGGPVAAIVRVNP